eukprot:638225_1
MDQSTAAVNSYHNWIITPLNHSHIHDPIRNMSLLLLKLKLLCLRAQITYHQWRSRISWKLIVCMIIVFSCICVIASITQFITNTTMILTQDIASSLICICTSNPSLFFTPTNVSQVKEMCWISDDYQPIIIKAQGRGKFCIQMYFVLAMIETLLVCMEQKSFTMIERMNSCDKYQITQLFVTYRVTRKKLFQYHQKLYKKRLLTWSDDALPQEMNASIMGFVIESEETAINKINDIDEASIQNGSCYYNYALNALSGSLLVLQMLLMFTIVFVALRIIKATIFPYSNEFVFYLIVAITNYMVNYSASIVASIWLYPVNV